MRVNKKLTAKVSHTEEGNIKLKSEFLQMSKNKRIIKLLMVNEKSVPETKKEYNEWIVQEENVNFK